MWTSFGSDGSTRLAHAESRSFEILWWIPLRLDLSWAKLQRGRHDQWMIRAHVKNEYRYSISVGLSTECSFAQLWRALFLAGGIELCFASMLDLICTDMTEYIATDQRRHGTRILRARFWLACASMVVGVFSDDTQPLHRLTSLIHHVDSHSAPLSLVITLDVLPWSTHLRIHRFCQAVSR